MEKVWNGIEKSSESCDMLKTVPALALYLGFIHFNFIFILFATFFLSLSKALLVFGFLFLFVVIPVDKNSMFGRKLSKYICKHICSYFPVKLHLEDPKAFRHNRAHVFGYEPHSAFPLGMVALAENAGLMPLAKTTFLASSAVFYIPFLRHVWTWMGFTAVTKKNFISSLEAGYSCILVPGGIREALFLEPHSEDPEVVFGVHDFNTVVMHSVKSCRGSTTSSFEVVLVPHDFTLGQIFPILIVFLKERRGFVRVAMEMGVPLVPVFCFGQTNSYKWWKVPGLIQKLARFIKIMPLFYWGIYGSPIPFKNPLYIVVGRPIETEKNPEPTMEQVDRVHSQFVEALKDLFARHKAKAGYTDLQLKIL